MLTEASDSGETRVDFIATDELHRSPSKELPAIDRKYLVDHARYIGIKKYAFTKEEYERLRNIVDKLRLSKQLVQELDKDYNFAYEITRKVRLGAINSITGLCYNTALCNYAETAAIIERKAQDADEQFTT